MYEYKWKIPDQGYNEEGPLGVKNSTIRRDKEFKDALNEFLPHLKRFTGFVSAWSEPGYEIDYNLYGHNTTVKIEIEERK